jgi:FtsP/CotA-like multicopper oxidase with cupredoxin domain
MNLSVLLVTVIVAALLAGPLMFFDARARAANTNLRDNGVEGNATVAAYSIQHRKPMLTCTSADGVTGDFLIPTFSDKRYRKGDTVRVRTIVLDNQTFGELIDEPRRSIGRGVGISLGVGIILLGLVLAALS